jgi:6-phosphogluconate dehydrogenase (decarboxylating)
VVAVVGSANRDADQFPIPPLDFRRQAAGKHVLDIRRSAALESSGIAYLDVGTSGGIRGLERGFCLMIGGPAPVAERLDPIFRSLASLPLEWDP